LEEAKQVYVTLLTATTPYLFKVIKPEFYTQGTGNGIRAELFDFDSVDEDRVDWKGYNEVKEQEKQERMDDCVEDLVSLYKCGVRKISMDDESKDM
jgi:hypothetical protein